MLNPWKGKAMANTYNIAYRIQYDGFWYDRVSTFITKVTDREQVRARFRKQLPQHANVIIDTITPRSKGGA
jgi:hypothetical protein